VNNTKTRRVLHRFQVTVDYLSNFCFWQGYPPFNTLVRVNP